eukprot:TRINITY_DN10431_c0_g1_i2.p1 TRINITY_DN10431_c0_g1~~TRINITY_DN10431_c0_g1_i2.p1  ORF type:complete len:518 (-),score=167.78 TRINITY_DN10431_c0_g1_i2:133-1686(-)
MKTFGTALATIATAGAAISGSYYFYKKKKGSSEDEETRHRKQYAAELYLPPPEEILREDLLRAMQLDIKLMKDNNILHVDHLTEWCGDTDEIAVNRLLFKDEASERLGLPLKSLVTPGSFCIKDYQFEDEEELKNAERFMKAGPKKYTYFRKDEVKAAIVTCGGLCPGLNVVIREIVMTLWWNYGVRKIFGVKWGYSGFYEAGDNYIELTPDKVKEIQQLGGSILGAGRDVFNAEKIFNAIFDRQINQVYIIGGDGTHKGILELSQLVKARSARISLVGVPKTIDNDIKVIDYSFGFSSAVQAAVEAISSAHVEATCVKNGIGLLKLMGRDVGHIAMHASLASREVNICLVPEFKFSLDGKEGLLQYIFDKVLKTIGHCVIVVAEGAALGVNDRKLVKPGEDPRNVNIGLLLKNEILAYAKENNYETTLKYIDPSYIIRTVPANGADRQFCSVLAQNAVHGAMAGFTNFTSGIIRGVSVNLPIELVANGEKNRLVYEDRAWQRLLASTGQPSFMNYS